MSLADRDRDVLGYGDEAVSYGDEAVQRPANAILVAQASKQKKKKQAQAKTSLNRLTVNPDSMLKTKQLSMMLRKSSMPKALRTKIKFDSKTQTIELPNASTISASKGQEWISDLLAVDDDWEITTARLVIVVDYQSIMGQKLEPHLQFNEKRGKISDDVGLMLFTVDVHGEGEGMMLGKTVPNFRLSDRKSMTEIVRLKSKRGLSMIVTEIVIKKGDKVTVDPIKVSNSILAKNLVHELAAHAGLISQGKKAHHGDTRVDRNTKQIEKLFKSKTDKEEKELQKQVQTYIEAMKKEK